MRTAIDVTLAKSNRSKEQLVVMASTVRRSVDNAEQLIDALLALAVSERDPADVELVDLATVVEDALDDAGESIRRHDLRLAASLDEARVRGDRILLERLAGNLVENAVRHNIEGGWIEVHTYTDVDRARLDISNTGQLIEPELAGTLFEPFRRVAERTDDAKGAGLGLAIVRAIVTSHGGAIMARCRDEGGLALSLSLPRTSETV